MNFFKVVLASAIGYIIAGIILLTLLIVTVVGIASSSSDQEELPSDAVLTLKLNYPIVDRVQDGNPLAALALLNPNEQSPLGLNDILSSIDKAKTDNNIKGIILDLTTFEAGYAKLTEVRNKLEEFKATGKFIYAYADYYYFPTYFMASVADSVFVNPEGEMAFNGMVAQVTFFAGALEKLGVNMQVVRAGKFKGAVEAYTRNNLSPENKEQIEIYINSVFNETLAKISKSRKIDVAKLKADADELKMKSVNDFKSNGYIDAVAYRDQFYSAMKKRMGVKDDHKVPLISEQKYAKSLEDLGSGSDRVAVVYASGDIIGGKGDGTQIAADDLAETLKNVRLDNKVKAVVLRIDSRGGSSLASDIIWREAKLLSAAKPLIVSMSDVAASGGYYIATPARKIVAEPTTITGSIGVFGLIPNAQKLLNDKLGIEFEYVGTGKHSDIGRIDRDMTLEEREYIESIIDKIYDTFLSRVAEGRKMTKEQVHEVAQGRVWTGVMAKEVGLVDELGGLEKAIEIAAKEANITEYKLKEYPKVKDQLELIVNKMSGNTSFQSKVKEMAKYTGFESYAHYLSEFEKFGTKHSVQAIMPFDISVKNYSLH
ncbi:MAG TPA: signal peptide peptidase SppA [Bacteroidetes bacterium]|jgi:protease IV|nr:signal peptide peptidase SppA [Bacteroidota bacterium]|tara:strand:- start:1681 stop:3474 length:1794 start_codon:yes stop_codon:yes gene_type:complete